MEIHVYHHILLPAVMTTGVQERLDKILGLLQGISSKEETSVALSDTMVKALADQETVIQAVKGYLADLAAKLGSASTPEDIAAIQAELEAHNTELTGMLPTPDPAAGGPAPGAETAS